MTARVLVGCLALLISVSPQGAPCFEAETVRVMKVLDDNAIISRKNGESYLIEKGVGCLSLWRYEGKMVIVSSPSIFLGVGSKLIIPDADQECRIWDSERLEGSVGGDRNYASGMHSSKKGEDAVRIIQKGLMIAGYNPGEINGLLSEKTKLAFAAFAKSKGHTSSEVGVKLTLLSLAIEVLSKGVGRPGSLELATALKNMAMGVTTHSSSKNCSTGHWVGSVLSDGSIVKLEDGSVWKVDDLDVIDTMLWLPTEDITICGSQLINTDSGDTVTASRIK